MFSIKGEGVIPVKIKIARAFTDRLKKSVESLTPVDTGLMKSKYSVTSLKDRIAVSNYAVNPKTKFPYPRVIEFGSVKVAPQAPMQRGVKKVIDRIPENITVVLGEFGK